MVLLAGALTWLFVGYTGVSVNSDAMNPTYTAGDRVYAERVDGSEIRRGDVVLFRAGDWSPPGHGPDRFLKRVVALGGDRVSGAPGEPVTVNGRPLDEPYVMSGEPGAASPRYSVTVPAGRMFLLGDYRGNSRDSRSHLDTDAGTRPLSSVQARALDSPTMPLTLASTALLGLLATLTALPLAIAAKIAHSRAKRALPPHTDVWHLAVSRHPRTRRRPPG
ncbi:signal peptidase I [Streptomyces polyrhachis]|uniref:Signal peptidase I n=1 Tax=Streptomyces polyrhachis TaxID=1282885 RepID=A0ABW2GB67_9ACTN